MRAGTLGLALLAGLGLHDAARAQVWERLAGRWQGTGEVGGMAATPVLAFAPALGGRAHRLSFDNRMRGADGRERPFAAEAVYLCEGAACRGHWYDTRGAILPLATREEADALVVDWGDAGKERGRTTYRLQDDGVLDVTDEVLGQDGRWKVFGRSRLTRAAD